jgi:hypothetical protein
LDSERQQRIAVIAVHGVGHQEPKESARAIARMLSGLRADGTSDPRYGTFNEVGFQIPVVPVRVSPQPEEPPEGVFDERPAALRREQARLKADDGGPSIDPSIDFMRNQLRGYAEHGVYKSTVLRAARSDALLVDVYEMFWADMSRLQTGALRFFFALYELLFHLSGLGRKALDWASIELSADKAWARLVWFRRWADRFLGLFIPALNLEILAVAVFVLMSELLLRIVGDPPWRPHFFLGLAVAWVVVVGLGMAALPRVYQRAGMRRVSILTGLPSAAFFLWFVFGWHGSANQLRSAALEALIVIKMLLDGFWFLLFLANMGGVLAQRACTVRREPTSRGRRASAAALTGQLTGVLATAVFMLVSVGFWVALVMAGKPLVAEKPFEEIPMPWPILLPLRANKVGALADALSRAPQAPFLAGAFAIILVAAGISVVGLWPLIRSESKLPPDVPSGFAARLERAFRHLGTAGQIVSMAVVFLLPLGSVLGFLLRERRPEWLAAFAAWSADIAAALGVLFLVGMAILSIRALRALSLKFNLVLDVALEVDGYLRETPREGTLRARVCARYAALLRHVCSDDAAYDAAVIVAHSQGCVITADLLRFLQVEPDPTLARLGRDLPVYMFTMGNPLKQLYARRFPHLYLWARSEEDVPATGDLLPEDAPEPTALGLRCWVNAYRSGDYVGRNLWRRDSAQLWDLELSQDVGGIRREFCIGSGAHTHYWDTCAPQVGQEIDRLIGATPLRWP